MAAMKFSARIWKEEGMYVAECNEIPNLASQGTTVKAAMANLREAAEL